jgi:hypothetical protein
VVPANKDLPPIAAYSDECDLDLAETHGFAQLLRDVLLRRIQLLEEGQGSAREAAPPGRPSPASASSRAGASPPADRSSRTDPSSREGPLSRSDAVSGTDVFSGTDPSSPADPACRAAWDRLIARPGAGLDGGQPGELAGRIQVGPLLTTAWHQGAPYQNLCPVGDYGWRTVVGCVAVAVAQILRYHEWPAAGAGSHSYWWNGDQSCHGDTPGAEVFADFSDPYDWSNMPDQCTEGSPQEEQDAVAELCYEVAAACETDFGVCGSAAGNSRVVAALPEYFRYSGAIDEQWRMAYTGESWFAMIQQEIDAGRPLFYGITNHAMVCDGWRVDGGLREIHINYGWGGPQSAWYTLDDIWGSDDLMFEEVIRWILPDDAAPIVVRPDGSGDYTTIQAAIDAAIDGQTIELADGVYHGPGNRNLSYDGKSITIRSRSGNPEGCVIDCKGGPSNPHVGFIFASGEGPGAVLEGITIIRAYRTINPGAIVCENASPTIRNCALVDNPFGWYANGSATRFEECSFRASSFAGAFCGGGNPAFDRCTFFENDGPGIEVGPWGQVTVTGCTFCGNASSRGAVRLGDHAEGTFENTIIAFNPSGCAVDCGDGASAALSCCDLYGNAGGDWIGCLADQSGVEGNRSVDPLFCDREKWALELQAGSPCRPENDPGCDLIGAWPVGCASTGVEDVAVAKRPGIYPNPTRGSCEIHLRAPASRSAVVEVFDVRGRRVRRLLDAADRRSGPDGAVLPWDGRDEAGRRVPTGVYLVESSSPAGEESYRVVLIR